MTGFPNDLDRCGVTYRVKRESTDLKDIRYLQALTELWDFVNVEQL